jgi:hypothetical protein
MTKKKRTLLRPMDVAWQAYQAAANEVSSVYWSPDDLSAKFNAWWAQHPQTTPDGELKK